MMSPSRVGGDEALALLFAAVLDDRGHRPIADHQVGRTHTRTLEFLADRELLHGARGQTVRLWPVRGHEAGVSEGLATRLRLLRQRGNHGADALAQRLDLVAQRNAAVATQAFATEARNRGVPARRAARERAHGHGPAQRKVSVMLPGEADTTEDLDAVLGIVDRVLHGDGAGGSSGDGELATVFLGVFTLQIGRSSTRGIPSSGGGELAALQHVRAQVLDRLERPDGPAELLTHLRVRGGRLLGPARDAGALSGSQGDEQIADQIGVEPGQQPLGGHQRAFQGDAGDRPGDVERIDRLDRDALPEINRSPNLAAGPLGANDEEVSPRQPGGQTRVAGEEQPSGSVDRRHRAIKCHGAGELALRQPGEQRVDLLGVIGGKPCCGEHDSRDRRRDERAVSDVASEALHSDREFYDAGTRATNLVTERQPGETELDGTRPPRRTQAHTACRRDVDLSPRGLAHLGALGPARDRFCECYLLFGDRQCHESDCNGTL